MRKVIASVSAFIVGAILVAASGAGHARAEGEYTSSSVALTRTTLVCDGRHRTKAVVRTFADPGQTVPVPDVPVLVGWYLPDGTPAQATGVTSRRGVFRASFEPDTHGTPGQFIVVFIVGHSISHLWITCEAPRREHTRS
jgi:hypothetical protein